MNVALLTNAVWLDDELPLFRALVVGLIDENVRVVQVVPDELGDGEISSFGRRLDWRDSRFHWLRTRRLTQLAAALREQQVNVLHALDAQLWPGALRLGQELECAVVLHVRSAADLPAASSAMGRTRQNRPAFTAATTSLGKALLERLGPDAIVQVTNLSAHVSDQHEPAPDDAALCAVVVGNGRHDANYEALLEGLDGIVQQWPQSQFFLDGQDTDQHRLWRAASRRKLLANVSLAPRRLGHRELLMRADVIIQPQALGVARGLLIQAMANGVPVLALRDPWLDHLIDGHTAWLVDQPDPTRWNALLRKVIEQPEQTLALTQSARQHVRQKHVPARQVALSLALYRRMTGEGFLFKSE